MDINITSALIGAGGVFIGAIVGGFIAGYFVWLQLKHQEKHDRRDLKINKFERIHELLGIIDHTAVLVFGEIVAEVRNISYESAIKGRVPVDELRMLVNFYSPEIKESVDKIIGSWYELGSTLGKTVDKPIDINQSKIFVKRSSELVESIRFQTKQSQEVLSRLIREDLS